jgi:hypothetical protein
MGQKSRETTILKIGLMESFITISKITNIIDVDLQRIYGSRVCNARTILCKV